MMTVAVTTPGVTTAMDCKGDGVGGNYDWDSNGGNSNDRGSDNDNCSSSNIEGGGHIQQSLKPAAEETAVVETVMAAVTATETTIN